MGDCIRFNDMVVWTRKTYIQFWLHMLIQEIAQIAEPPAWLLTARDIWDEQAHSYVGEIAPCFDYILTTDDRAQIVAGLLTRAIGRVWACGNTIPRDELNRMELGGKNEGKFTGDPLVADYVRVADALVRLLTRQYAEPRDGDLPIEKSASIDSKLRRGFLARYGGDADAAMREDAEDWRHRKRDQSQ